MEDSVFTKIIKGEIPCHKIYEDERVLAFLDISPTAPAHTLVIPKNQVELVWDVDDEDYVAVMDAARRIAKRMQEVLGVKFIGEKIIGTDVPHAHVHVFPLTGDMQDVSHIPAELVGSDSEALARMAERLRIM